jgi:DNA ligase (NAD+)
MSLVKAKKRWQYLVDEIRYHDRLYYQENTSLSSDEEYDLLRAELNDLERQYPQLVQEDSPTQHVGYAPSHSFQKATHLAPLYSLDNVFDESQLEAFIQKACRFLGLSSPDLLSWVAEPKVDGLTVVLRYEAGKLTRAATRGDGVEGELITANALTIKGIPHSLQGEGWPDLMEIRGEVYMLTHDFAQLNKEREEEGLSFFSNPRNAAAGSLRQLDAKVTACRPLVFVVHGASFMEKAPFVEPTYTGCMEKLAVWGLPCTSHSKVCHTQKEMMSFYSHMMGARGSLGYEIDGVVYKINALDQQYRLGYSSRAPRYAVAHKLPSFHAVSVVHEIKVQVGRTGVLTPVAYLEPILVGGVVVSRASLHNANEIERKDIRVGDTVCVERAGDVIPQVVSVMKEKRSTSSVPYVFPTRCPVCEGAVAKKEGEVAWRCIAGMACPAQGIWRIRHFASRHAFDIEGLGKKQVEFLYHKGLVRCPSDLFQLKFSDLNQLEKWGDKSASNLIQAIEVKKNIEFHRFVYALGITQVGEATAKLMAHHYETIEKWLESMEKAVNTDSCAWIYLLSIEGVGYDSARDIVLFVQDNRRVLETLLGYVTVLPEKRKTTSSILSGKSVVFTGTLKTMTRAEAKQSAERLGARVLSSFSHHTDYLVVGEGAGKKLEKAKGSEVRILTEEEWGKVLSGGTDILKDIA